jgi:HAD superfamily phosphatase (TIGR01668 family)
MQLPPERVAMVGDRLFTDVLAGNRLGLFTVLVQPMVNPLSAHRGYPIHSLEVWLSKLIGASFYRDPSPLPTATSSPDRPAS